MRSRRFAVWENFNNEIENLFLEKQDNFYEIFRMYLGYKYLVILC
jgi:hypothetical protein